MVASRGITGSLPGSTPLSNTKANFPSSKRCSMDISLIGLMIFIGFQYEMGIEKYVYCTVLYCIVLFCIQCYIGDLWVIGSMLYT